MNIQQPPINALGTINADHIRHDIQVRAWIWIYKPNHSWLIRLHATPSGVVPETTCLKVSSQQLAEHMKSVAEEKGLAGALNEAFGWLEEQTKTRRSA